MLQVLNVQDLCCPILKYRCLQFVKQVSPLEVTVGCVFMIRQYHMCTWWPVVNRVMDLWVPQNADIS